MPPRRFLIIDPRRDEICGVFGSHSNRWKNSSVDLKNSFISFWGGGRGLCNLNRHFHEHFREFHEACWVTSVNRWGDEAPPYTVFVWELAASLGKYHRISSSFNLECFIHNVLTRKRAYNNTSGWRGVTHQGLYCYFGGLCFTTTARAAGAHWSVPGFDLFPWDAHTCRRYIFH